jgi:Sulfotransferase family
VIDDELNHPAAVARGTPGGLSRVFLVGCPRSGTTLLQALLGAHKDIASFPESHIFIKGRRLPARLVPGLVARKNLKRFARTVEVDTLYTRRRLALRQQTYQLDLVCLLDELTRKHQKRLWIEKTPNHVLSIPEIRRLVPSSRFIHLIRDGRAVVASLYEVTRTHASPWGGSYSIERCIAEWNHAIAASSAAMDTGNDGIVIDYKMLATDPALELQTLCKFLSLSYEPQILTAYSNVPSSIVNSEEEWKNRVSGPIHDTGLQKYHQLFSPGQQEFIESSLVPLPANLSCRQGSGRFGEHDN